MADVETFDDEECIHGIATLTCDRCGPRAAERRAVTGPVRAERAVAAPSRLTRVDPTHPMHLLVKWNPDRDAASQPRTVDRHRRTAESVGSTWWGCVTDGVTKSIDAKRLEQVNWQLGQRIDTYAYLFRTGDDAHRAETWRAKVLAITTEASEIDASHRPADMSIVGTWLFIELADFERLPSGWVVERLVRWDDPAQSIISGLRTRTSPLFVAVT